MRNGPLHDADDAGPRGLHHQHHWGSVSPIWRYQAAAIVFFRVLYDGFWLAPGVVKLKITTSGPNPWFWAQNPGFGPDVVTFGVNSSKTTKNDLIWPRTWVWARCGNFECFGREPKKMRCLRCPPLGAAP